MGEWIALDYTAYSLRIEANVIQLCLHRFDLCETDNVLFFFFQTMQLGLFTSVVIYRDIWYGVMIDGAILK